MPTFSWILLFIILPSTEGMYKNKQVHFYLFEFNLYSYLSKKKRIRESITFQFLFSEGIFLIFHDSGMKGVIVIQNNFNIMIYFVKCLNFDRDYFLQATERKVRSSGDVSSVLLKDQRWVLYLRVRKYDVFNVLVQCIDLNQILHYYMYALKYLIKQTIIDNINIRTLILY